MNVLVKPQLENGILVEELESIIENAPQILNNMVGLSNFNYNLGRRRRRSDARAKSKHSEYACY
jgi:hypothetical protein